MTQRLVLLKGTVNTSLCCGHAQRNILTSDCAIAKQDPKIEEKKNHPALFQQLSIFLLFLYLIFSVKKKGLNKST